jgi:hypothetical protein
MVEGNIYSSSKVINHPLTRRTRRGNWLIWRIATAHSVPCYGLISRLWCGRSRGTGKWCVAWPNHLSLNTSFRDSLTVTV